MSGVSSEPYKVKTIYIFMFIRSRTINILSFLILSIKAKNNCTILVRGILRLGGWNRCKLYRLSGDKREIQQISTQIWSGYKRQIIPLHCVSYLDYNNDELLLARDDWWAINEILGLPGSPLTALRCVSLMCDLYLLLRPEQLWVGCRVQCSVPSVYPSLSPPTWKNHVRDKHKQDKDKTITCTCRWGIILSLCLEHRWQG